MEELDEFITIAKNIIDRLEKGTPGKVWASDTKTIAANVGDLLEHASLDLQNSEHYQELKALQIRLLTLIASHIELFDPECGAGNRFR